MGRMAQNIWTTNDPGSKSSEGKGKQRQINLYSPAKYSACYLLMKNFISLGTLINNLSHCELVYSLGILVIGKYNFIWSLKTTTITMIQTTWRTLWNVTRRFPLDGAVVVEMVCYVYFTQFSFFNPKLPPMKLITSLYSSDNNRKRLSQRAVASSVTWCCR